ncbi:MAG: hypothetical protein R3D25_00940 [Geminicoccaceae bacterium]
MSETNRAFFERMELALAEVRPRLKGDDPGLVMLRAEHDVAAERLKVARRAGSEASDEDLRSVRLAVERLLQHVGRLTA